MTPTVGVLLADVFPLVMYTTIGVYDPEEWALCFHILVRRIKSQPNNRMFYLQ